MTDTKYEPKKKDEPKAVVKPAAKKATPAVKKDKPKRAPRKSDADREAEELREIRLANEEKRLQNLAPEVHAEVPAGDKDKVVSVHALGGVVYVNSHGEAKLDRAQALHLAQTLQAAFQVVS